MRLILAIAFAVIGPSSWASFFPKNDLYIPVSEDISANAISQSTFNAAIDKVYKVYAPIVKKRGYTLVFSRQWDNGTVNSSTYVSGKQWIINSFGGLARYQGMNTVEAYAAVACHELGHHMGGAPRYTSKISWASTEGESDYWATKECMKAIGYNASTISQASVALAKVLASMAGEHAPSMGTPDMRVAKKTQENHPAAQCRLDTFLNGLDCPARGSMSSSDPRVNSCYSYPSASGYEAGSRPRCWFAPK